MPRRLWLMLHEPRIITAATGVMWAILIGIGTAALLAPPATISHQMGPTLTTVWAILLMVGGALGLVGCLPGWFWIERVGLILTATGAAMYLAVVLMLHYAEPGSRLVQAGFVSLALVSLVVRWLRVRGPQIDPTRGARPHAHP